MNWWRLALVRSLFYDFPGYVSFYYGPEIKNCFSIDKKDYVTYNLVHFTLLKEEYS